MLFFFHVSGDTVTHPNVSVQGTLNPQQGFVSANATIFYYSEHHVQVNCRV